MDPFIGAILLAWFVCRGPLEDAWYGIKRQESPRAKTRRELQERKGGSVASKLAHATADRLATRIANPKEITPGPLRTYLSNLWADAIAARDDQRAQRAEDRRRKAAGEAGDTPDTPEGVTAADSDDSGEEKPRRRWWQWKQLKPEPEPEPETASEPVRAIAERLDTAPEPDTTAATPGAEPEPTTKPEDTGPRTWADRYVGLAPDQKDLVNRAHDAWSGGSSPSPCGAPTNGYPFSWACGRTCWTSPAMPGSVSRS
jgi:hypothetical protein